MTDTSHNLYIYYRIYKGNNRGGNNANIYVNDYGVMPTKKFGKENAIQDNNWHLWVGPYSRGDGDFWFQFIFDKSDAADPRCSASPYIS